MPASRRFVQLAGHVSKVLRTSSGTRRSVLVTTVAMGMAMAELFCDLIKQEAGVTCEPETVDAWEHLVRVDHAVDKSVAVVFACYLTVKAYNHRRQLNTLFYSNEASN